MSEPSGPAPQPMVTVGHWKCTNPECRDVDVIKDAFATFTEVKCGVCQSDMVEQAMT